MRTLITALLAMSVAAFLASCGTPATTGTIVGFVVNGQTGERVNFYDSNNLTDKADNTSQIYTLIGGTFTRATPCGSGFVNATNGVKGDGCFKISGVPYGSEIPIFVSHDGFESFYGKLIYPGESTDMLTGSVIPAPPQIVRNVRIFPKNYAVDYRIFASWDNRGINGVTIACQIDQKSLNAVATDGDFIQAQNTVSATITGQTGNEGTLGVDGFFKIAGTDLVLGAPYHCEGFRPGELYESYGTLVGEANFTPGVDQIDVRMELKANAGVKPPDGELLYAVNSNADDPQTMLGANAKLIINFNRPVEVVPNSPDCQVASIMATDTNGDNSTPPTLPIDTPRTNGSETVSVASSNNDMTLTISVKGMTGSFDPKDINTTISFRGIYVHPKNTTVDTNIFRRIGPASGNGCTIEMALIGATALQNAHTGGAQTATLLLF